MQFDQEKISQLNSDFTLFHPTVKQLKALYEMTSIVSEKIGLKPETVRNITIKATIKYQQMVEKFHYEHRETLAQSRVVVTHEIGELLKKEFRSLLSNETKTDVDNINEVLDLSFKEYMDKKFYE